MKTNRRGFLRTSGVAALGPICPAVIPGLHAFADEPSRPPDCVRFGSDLEPIVRLIEETPRDRCIPVMFEQLRAGLPYRRFLAAIFLAAIRKRDSHHSVYLIHSAHEASLDLRPDERLLPLFWALDHYKWQQQDFPTPPLPRLEGPIPSAATAAAEFRDAMRGIDGDKSERALIALVRSDGARRAFEQFWPYACQDGGAIGHKAIGAVNCWRTLETIGWRHAEPVLRFVIRDFYRGGGGPDRYYRTNAPRADELLKRLPPGWPEGAADRGATLELFALLRQGRSSDACILVGEQLARGVGAQPIWDAVHVAAAELMILYTSSINVGGRPVHVNTTANALHYAFTVNTSARTRVLILLQAVAWVADFLRVQLGAGRLGETSLTDLNGGTPHHSPPDAVVEVFSQLPPHLYEFDSRTKTGRGHVLEGRRARDECSRKIFALMTASPNAAAGYAQAARSWLCLKSTVDAHEYKFPTAIFEDCEWISAEWRPRLLAASALWLHGSQSQDSPVIQQARELLRKHA